MKTSKRLEHALKKLYEAFHNNELNPECCKQCAVGNILDNKDNWKHLSDSHGTLELNYIGRVNQAFGKTFNGYTPLQLLKIEHIFLNACAFKLPLHHKNEKPKDPMDKNVLFQGLNEVVKYLCHLDHISNVMDYTKLFEFENDKPKHKLHFAQ